jgi:hypothetical protein
MVGTSNEFTSRLAIAKKDASIGEQIANTAGARHDMLTLSGRLFGEADAKGLGEADFTSVIEIFNTPILPGSSPKLSSRPSIRPLLTAVQRRTKRTGLWRMADGRKSWPAERSATHLRREKHRTWNELRHPTGAWRDHPRGILAPSASSPDSRFRVRFRS